MSPAPMVRTRSPGRAAAATAAGRSARSGMKRARPPGTASAMSSPLTPGSGSSRGRVHVQHERLVGQAERGAELRREDPGPAEQVRLEGREDPALRPDVVGRAEVGSEFGRVVRVAVEHQHAGGLALRFHPAAHAAIGGEARGGLLRAQPKLEGGGVGGRCVQRVVTAWDADLEQGR